MDRGMLRPTDWQTDNKRSLTNLPMNSRAKEQHPLMSSQTAANCWIIKRSICLVKQISLLEIASAAALRTAVDVDLSGVFHAIDSSCASSCQQAHACSLWNASCTSCASNTLLRRCGSMFGFRSSDSMLDADWCCNDSLTAPLFARLRQLHSFKQRLLSHLAHCPNSMDSTTNTATLPRDSCHCC